MAHGCRQLLPGVSLNFKLLSSGFRELVEFGLAIVLRCTPAGFDPAPALQAMKGRIERPLLHSQHIARNLPDTFRNGPAVKRLQRQSAQDEQVQRSLWKINRLGWHLALAPYYFYKKLHLLL